MGFDISELAALRRARDRMDREFASPLTVADLAATACMSPSHFSRRFRAAYDETVGSGRLGRGQWPIL